MIAKCKAQHIPKMSTCLRYANKWVSFHRVGLKSTSFVTYCRSSRVALFDHQCRSLLPNSSLKRDGKLRLLAAVAMHTTATVTTATNTVIFIHGTRTVIFIDGTRVRMYTPNSVTDRSCIVPCTRGGSATTLRIRGLQMLLP